MAQSIPVVKEGRIELDSGESFLLESEEGLRWLDMIDTVPETGKEKGKSFRYEPTGEAAPFTARNQPVRGVSYWYGSRKVAGEVRKAYIGKQENMTLDRLEEVASKLAKQEPKTVDKKPKAVGDKKQKVVEAFDDRIEDWEAFIREIIRFEVREQVQRAVEEALRGKLADASFSSKPSIPKQDESVVETPSPNLTGNLEAQNKGLKEQLDTVTKELAVAQQQLAEIARDRDELAVVREELAQLKKEAQEAAAELHRKKRSVELEKVSGQQQLTDARAELADAKVTILKQGDKIRELERGYNFKPNPVKSALRLEIGNRQVELSDLKQNSPIASIDLPDAGSLLNELKSKGKKSTVTLADVKKILEILEGGFNG